MHLFLHAGTEKTGTTSIQEFLRLNRRELRQQKVFVPETLQHGDTGNHRRLVALVADDDAVDDFYAEVDIVSLDKRRKTTGVWRSAFDKEYAEAIDCNTTIITSEHLHSRLRRKNELEKLKEFLQNRFESITVLIYLRDPLDTIIASISTAVKAGGALMEIPDPSHPGWRFLVDHRNTLQSWGDVFGQNNVVPRLFIPSEFKAGDVIVDFSEICNLTTEGLEAPPRTNESISLVGLQLLAHLNQSIPRVLSGGGLNPARGRLTEIISKHFTTGLRLHVGQDIADRYEAAFRDSNAWVQENFFPHRRSLFPDTSSKGPTTTSNLLDEDLNDITRFIEDLWRHQKEEVR